MAGALQGFDAEMDPAKQTEQGQNQAACVAGDFSTGPLALARNAALLAPLRDAPRDTPLFQSAMKRKRALTGKAIHVNDVCRMMKRRLKDICLPLLYSPHSFRVTTITDLLTQGVPLEDVQRLAGHADPRTTRLYERRDRKITRNIVERISV